MFEPAPRLRMNAEKAGKSSPEQNKHIYTKILQNSSSNILSARTSKTNSKTPYELSLLQDQKVKNDKNVMVISDNPNDKDFKSIYSSNLASSIDFKGLNFKHFQESFNNASNASNDNSRNMRKSLENLNIYTKTKPGDKYTELKQSIMNQIKFQNFKELDEKTSSRENSKQHATNSTLLSNHKSALNYFSMNNKKTPSSTANQNAMNAEKPPTLNKNFKKINIAAIDITLSPDKKHANTNKNAFNSIKKDHQNIENSTHLHSNKNNAKYYEVLDKSNRKPVSGKNPNFNKKDIASHSFQQNPSNVSENSQTGNHVSSNNIERIVENNENNTQNLFDFTLLKSYNEKLYKQEKTYNNESYEGNEQYIRENVKKDIKGTPPAKKQREITKSLPATTKNSGSLSFKSNMNELINNNKAYNLIKTRKEEENKDNIAIYNSFLQNPNVKVNDLLNEELKSNSEKLIKNEKIAKCEDCEQNIVELENIYEKVRIMFDIHKKKEAGWLNEKAFYIKQIDYLNTLIKQYIQEKSA